MYLGTVTSAPKRRDMPLQLLSRGVGGPIYPGGSEALSWAYPGESETLSWAYLGVEGLILGLSRRVRGPILGLPRGRRRPYSGPIQLLLLSLCARSRWGRRPYLGPILGGLRSYLVPVRGVGGPTFCLSRGVTVSLMYKG